MKHPLPTQAVPPRTDQLAQDDAESGAELARWHDLVTQIGQDIAGPLSGALERILTFSTTGRIDRAGLRALREEVEQARQAGMICQQMVRLARGVRQSHERVHLTHTLQSVLAHRSRELQARGVQIEQTLQPLEVTIDAPLLFALLNTLLDWAVSCTHGAITLTLDTQPWPALARLTCRFAYRPLDQSDSEPAPTQIAALDNLLWRLLDESARALQLQTRRTLEPAHVKLELVFPHTLNPLLDGPSDAAPAAPEARAAGTNERPEFVSSVNSKPLAGSHVLVIASRRDLRVQIREAIRNMGLIVDFVTSLDECTEFCSEGLPHAIVIEASLKGSRFQQLMSDIRAEVPEFVFIEIEEQGAAFQISSVSPTGIARVGRDAILGSLPSALVYELTRVM